MGASPITANLHRHEHFERLPSVMGSFMKAVVTPGKGRAAAADVPLIGASCSRVVLEPQRVDAWRRLCHVEGEGALIPSPALQVPTFALHAVILGHPAYPLPAAGTVHLHNRFTLHQPVEVGEPLRLECAIEEVAAHRKGVTIGLRAVAFRGDEAVWESASRYLSPAGRRLPKEQAPREDRPADPDLPEVTTFEAPANIGRLFGQVTGDFNPIHVSALSARLFGFRRAIAHGMWTASRSAGTLPGVALEQPGVLEVSFARPLLLPGSARVLAQTRQGTAEFRAASPNGKDVYLRGSHSPLG